MPTGCRGRMTPTESLMPVLAPAGTAVAAADLVKVYGSADTAVRALSGVTVAFAAGEFTAIMGPSGSGKSTLMHCLAGLDSVTSGSVLIGGTELSGLGDKALTRLRRSRVGFVFQSFNLLPTLTAEQKIRLPLELAGRKPDPQWWDTVITATRDRGPPAAPPRGTVRRPAAARRLRPCPHHPARCGVRRRADRQPGLEVRCRAARLPAHLRQGTGPDGD